MRDDCVYLRDKVRTLDKRARCINETGNVPEARAPRRSAREKLMSWFENDPPRSGPTRSDFGRMMDAIAGVHSGGSGSLTFGGCAESSAAAASASATKEKEKDNKRPSVDESGAGAGGERVSGVPQKSRFPWREPAKHAPFTSYQSVARKPREPSVPKEPIPPGLLNKQFSITATSRSCSFLSRWFGSCR